MNLGRLFIPAPAPYPKVIPGLTSLRFFAAVAVVIMHFLIEFPFVTDGEGLPGRLYLAVDFFFILSGFILTHSYVESIEAGTFSAYNFYINRLARIYPIHLFTFIVSALTTCATVLFLGVYFDPGDSFPCFLRGIFLIHAWGFSDHLCFNGPSWSISAEWFAYLLFPLLIPAILKRGATATAVVCVLVFLSLCYAFYFFEVKAFTKLTTIGFLRILPEFALGASLYLIGRRTSLDFDGRGVLLTLAAMVFLFLVLHIPDGFIVLLFAAIIVIVAGESRKGRVSVLDHPLLVYWGEASYSLYMLHLLLWKAMVVPVLMRNLDGSKLFDFWFWVAWVVAFLLCFVLSSLCYSYIEKPAREAIKRRFLR